MKCKICKSKLDKSNKSGYCTNCYIKSPQYLEYQRNYQKKWYYDKNGKDKKKEYRQRKNVKKKYKEYQKKYQKENHERLKILKKEWARKNRNK